MNTAATQLDEIEANTPQRPIGMAVVLLVTGVVGLVAAFALTLETVLYYKDPSQGAACDFSVLVSCSHNMASSYGWLFGFPNPMLGMVAWPVVITSGVLVLAGIQLPAWYWKGLAFGTMLALLLVAGFVSFSVFNLRVLCPWCMLTWAVVIPLFWTIVFFTLKEGLLVGPVKSKWPERLYGWAPMLTALSYLFIIVLAQVQLDAINRIIADLTR